MQKEEFLKGKTILITGGIGKYTAIGLASQGATVIVTGRDKARVEAGVEEIKAKSSSNNVHLLLADLSLQSEVVKLADDFKANFSRLDVLVNNVGLLESKRRITADGVEAHFAVNVVTPYLLTLEHLRSDHTRTPRCNGSIHHDEQQAREVAG